MSFKKKTGKVKLNQKFEADLQSIFMEALSLHKQGNIEGASLVYSEIINICPQHYDATQLLGVVALQKKEYKKAIPLLKKAIELNPLIVNPYVNLGVAYRETGNLKLALECQNEAIARKHDHADAFYNRGNIHRDLKDFSLALRDYDAALALSPNLQNALHNRGLVLKELQEFDQARKSILTALELNPASPELHYDFGLLQMGNKDYWGSIKSFERAIELNPKYHQAYNEIGLALFTLRKYENALEYFNKSLELLPTYSAALNNRGLCHHELRNLAAAIKDFNDAISGDESNPNLHWNLALSLLTSGDLENGFKHYEWRFKTDQAKKTARTPTAKAWDGEASLVNKTLLIFSEQGFGDSIQFCRFINYIANSSTKVIFEVENQLFQLMNFLNNENIKVIKRGENLPHHDYQCALLSLPHALKIKSNDILFKKKYLQASKAKIIDWSTLLGEKTKLRVGIVWSGGIRPEDKENLLINERRNIPLNKLIALGSIQNIKLFSLQKGEPAESELEHSTASGQVGASITNLTKQLLDFTDTAALIENLDLVISVDTAIAHLAGALGKPVWMLNRLDTDWRWMHGRDTTPWYPSMKIFRQSTPGNWDEVIENVIRKLRETI